MLWGQPDQPGCIASFHAVCLYVGPVKFSCSHTNIYVVAANLGVAIAKVMRATCQHCRVAIDVTDGTSSPRQPHRRAGHLGESFVVLPQPLSQQQSDGLPRGGQVLQATSMHEQLRTVGRLLELSESCDECGVPLCEDCASGVLRELQRQLEEAHGEREVMQTAFAELEAGDEDVAEDETLSEADFEREMQAMRREEGELRAALEAAKREREALSEEAERLRGQRREQEQEAESRHAAINALELRRQQEADELLRQAQLVAHCERELGRLGRVNVYNDVFNIWHDGPFGTISALRLGRLPGVTVEWAEINAALGQARRSAAASAPSPPPPPPTPAPRPVVPSAAARAEQRPFPPARQPSSPCAPRWFCSCTPSPRRTAWPSRSTGSRRRTYQQKRRQAEPVQAATEEARPGPMGPRRLGVVSCPPISGEGPRARAAGAFEGGRLSCALPGTDGLLFARLPPRRAQGHVRALRLGPGDARPPLWVGPLRPRPGASAGLAPSSPRALGTPPRPRPPIPRPQVMLLACVKELLGHAASRPRAGVSAQPPNPIDEDCVGGLSVRLQFNQEERWTTAFKYLLQARVRPPARALVLGPVHPSLSPPRGRTSSGC